MKILIALVALLYPCVLFAHAIPVTYTPGGFSSSAVPPPEVGIRFSEAIATSSLGADIYGPDGLKILGGTPIVDTTDPRLLRRVLQMRDTGVYVVSWQVVSAVDGHFTKGAFTFYVGGVESRPELYGGSATHAAMDSHNFDEGLFALTRPDGGRTVHLIDSGDEPFALRVFATDEEGKTVEGPTPVVVLGNSKEGIGPMVVPVLYRGPGTYDIPGVLFVPNGEWKISVVFPYPGHYDINATFPLDYPSDILLARQLAREAHEHSLIVVRLSCAALALLLIGALLIIWRRRSVRRGLIEEANAPVIQ